MTLVQGFDPPLDTKIEYIVNVLINSGIETFESCEGSEGHAYSEPTVRFHGDRNEGLKAATIILQNNFPIRSLGRIWTVNDGELTGPYWEVIFWKDKI